MKRRTQLDRIEDAVKSLAEVVEVRLDDDGAIDEVVGKLAHIEMMDDNWAYLRIGEELFYVIAKKGKKGRPELHIKQP